MKYEAVKFHKLKVGDKFKLFQKSNVWIKRSYKHAQLQGDTSSILSEIESPMTRTVFRPVGDKFKELCEKL